MYLFLENIYNILPSHSNLHGSAMIISISVEKGDAG